MKTTILILLTAVPIALTSWLFSSRGYHKDKNGLTVNDYFPNCSDGAMSTFDGIPYDCVNGKWVVNEEILAEVKRQGYYTKTPKP